MIHIDQIRSNKTNFFQNLEDVFVELCEGRHALELRQHGQEKTHHHKSITIVNKVRSIEILSIIFCLSRFMKVAVHLYRPVVVRRRNIYSIEIFYFLVKRSCCDALRSCARPSLGRSLYALLIKDVLKFQRNPLYVR